MSRKIWEFLSRHHALLVALLLIIENPYTGGC